VHPGALNPAGKRLKLRLAEPGGDQIPNACFRDYRGSDECVCGSFLSPCDAASSWTVLVIIDRLYTQTHLHRVLN
jgi:hypothetical protein